MRQRLVWPFAALLAFALAACNLGAAPTPAPPTPTPRARAEQVARATEVAAQITATAEARALPTNTPTPRPSAPPRPTLAANSNGSQPIKATPIEFTALPIDDGQRYRDSAGIFAVTIPHEWEAYPLYEEILLAMFVAPEDGNELDTSLNVIVWDLPEMYWVLPLSDITNEALAEVRSALNKDYTFERVERIETNGLVIDRITSHDNVDDGYFVQAFMVVEHTLHVLTFYSPADQFEANEPLFDSILASYNPDGE